MCATVAQDNIYYVYQGLNWMLVLMASTITAVTTAAGQAFIIIFFFFSFFFLIAWNDDK